MTMNATSALTYISAGKGRVTLRSIKTGTRFTYRFSRPRHPRRETRNATPPIFVRLLNGSDNTNDYVFIGSLWRDSRGRLVYRHSRKTRVTADAASVKALAWTMAQLSAEKLPPTVEVWHEGVCGRCGRRLTVPESLEAGIGPECAAKL